MKTKQLEKEFTKGSMGLTSRFVQFKRNEYAAIYQRLDPQTGELQTWEVFAIKVGQPNEFVKRSQPEEMYPSTSHFGISAWDVRDQCRAEEIFDELTKGKGCRKAVETGFSKVKTSRSPRVRNAVGAKRRGRGRVAAVRPAINWPKTFTMKELAAKNSVGWTKPLLYIEVQKLLGTKVQELERVRPAGQRGRPTVVYLSVK